MSGDGDVFGRKHRKVKKRRKPSQVRSIQPPGDLEHPGSPSVSRAARPPLRSLAPGSRSAGDASVLCSVSASLRTLAASTLARTSLCPTLLDLQVDGRLLVSQVLLLRTPFLSMCPLQKPHGFGSVLVGFLKTLRMYVFERGTERLRERAEAGAGGEGERERIPSRRELSAESRAGRSHEPEITT